MAIAANLTVLAAGEALLRSIGPGTTDAVQVLSWREYEPDDHLGWAPKATGVHVLKVGDIEVREVSNSLRMLGPELGRSKPAGTLRILLLGDSITEALEVVRADRSSTQLEHGLQADGRAVEVLNAGRTGYQTDQEVLYYEREGRELQADLVILVAYLGNDIIGNTQAENEFATAVVPKPRFRLVDGSLVLSEAPGPAGAPDRTLAAPSGIDAVKAWLAERSALYRAARAAWAQVLVLTSPRRVPPSWEVFRARSTSQVDEGWMLTSILIGRLRADVEREGARLLVVIVPDERQVTEGKWRDFLAFYRLEASEWDRDVASRRFGRICADQQADCIDVLGALRAAPTDPYLPRGGHLNATGHKIVSQALHHWISQYVQRTE
ncbi:MAG: SGNH/GDSL hydrolase family protein [Elusimicrobia bacterium]|nr:SGNH/GDSL hydrolase family protein [Elusimicrobiota bacterium]